MSKTSDIKEFMFFEYQWNSIEKIHRINTKRLFGNYPTITIFKPRAVAFLIDNKQVALMNAIMFIPTILNVLFMIIFIVVAFVVINLLCISMHCPNPFTEDYETITWEGEYVISFLFIWSMVLVGVSQTVLWLLS